MAPRPKNPPPDRRQEILDAALRVFSEKGYAAATNADIAREAGVTPAALYYYFPSKADLFRAALLGQKSVLETNVEQLSDQLLEVPPEMLLPMVARTIADFVAQERTVAIIRIILSEGSRHKELLEVYRSQVVGQLAPVIFRYFEHQMDLGRIPKMDPRLCVLQLAGPIVATVIIRDVLKLDIAQGLTNDAVAQSIIETLLPALLGQNKE